ncbi:MAG TPA: flagellar motor protein MotB, partial [Flavobacterium sp.]|nr:flagellar motor protein MotB [Flavobacterium sp.]
MKSKIVSILLFGLFALNVAAQSGINKADKNYDRFAYIDAIKTYERIAQKGYKSADLFQKLGNAYYFNSDFENAAKWYGELFAMGGEIEPEYYYRYAQSLKSVKQYDKADEMMRTFTGKVAGDQRAQNFKSNYMDMIRANSGRYEMTDAGVNSEYSDYGSAMYDGQLVFASARDTGNFSKRKHSWTNQYFTNLYSAEAKGDSLGTVEKFGQQMNSKYNEAASPAFAKDGKTVYFTRNNFLDGKRGRDGNRNTLVKIYKATMVEKDGKKIWTDV